MVEEKFEAIVQKICSDGKHGPYVVTVVRDVGFVTFSLDKNVWTEESPPEPGEVVLLFELRKKRAGWKAMRGRRYRPSDEQKTSRQQ